MSPIAMDVATDPAQVESPSSITNTTSWASLPVEVRQTILSLVCLPISGRRYNGLGSPKVARFATVCWEWQVFFEICTFRRLVLDPDSLGQFDKIIKRHDTRLAYIRKLWLRVQLPKYDCPDCDEPEDEATQHCDTEHRFNRCEIKDDYPFHYAEDLDLAPGMVDFHRTNIANVFSNYFHRGYPPPLYNEHFKRVQGTPICLEPQRGERGRFNSHYKSLPAVPMVKGLVMRRQFRRDIHVGSLSWLLSRSFVALEWFRFERTVSLEPHKQISFDQGFQLHLLPSLPKTLRQLSFTQWKIPKIERGGDLEEEVGSNISPHDQAYLPREMAKLSQRLERFCPPWQMDTAAFLQCVIELRESPEMLEGSLKRIILRCLLSSSGRSRHDFESLVILAAKAALSFPQLEVIELWGTCLDGQESCAYIFRYSYEDGRATIVWRSSEETKVAQARIIAKWSEVAQKHLHSTLTYNVIPFTETKAEISKSNGTCIYRHLLLKDLVFDPITQIILENEPYEWRLGEKSDSLQQGDPPNSNLANPDSSGGDPFMASLELDTDLASLDADLRAFDAELNVFLKRYHG